jgi:NitT/TauT family transport system substrate-binding protein
MVPPQTLATVEGGFAVSWINPEDYIKPQPMEIAVTLVNTDWAAKNPKQADGFMYALMRGTREYCDAYHRAPNRAEVISHIVKYTTVKAPAAIDKYPWGSRNVRGQVAAASVMDIQDFYLAEGQSDKKLALEQMVDMKYADAASARLGPYAPPATAKEPGCR